MVREQARRMQCRRWLPAPPSPPLARTPRPIKWQSPHLVTTEAADARLDAAGALQWATVGCAVGASQRLRRLRHARNLIELCKSPWPRINATAA